MMNLYDNDIFKKINLFVEKVNRQENQCIFGSDYPASVRVGPIEDNGFCGWKIKPYDFEKIINSLEGKLGLHLPNSYRFFVSKYLFPSFKYKGILIHGNTPEGTDYFEFRNRLYEDQNFSEILLENYYIQFARVSETNYDPVCFCLDKIRANEPQIVLLDHESIIINKKIVKKKIIAESFISFIE